MMPIAELVAVANSLDADHRSALGDLAAKRWGYQRATFIRSSASHVFVAGPALDGRRVVLRLRPASEANAKVLDRSARAAASLRRAGAPVAGSVPSTDGLYIEEVDGYLASALEAIEGDPVGGAALDTERSRMWGRLLADFHARGQVLALDDIPDPVSDLRSHSELGRLPRDERVYGLLHGDPELDNLVWASGDGFFVDLDDVRYGWYAGDVGFALRDWAPELGAVPDLTAPVPSAFITGYRERRPLSDDELSWLPVLARASAAETLARLEPLVAATRDPDWPDWATALDRRIRDRAADLGRILSRP